MKGPSIQEIINPKEQTLKISTKSLLISRVPGTKGDDYKTAVLRLFEVNNPHKKQVFPTKVYRFSNIEKVRIMRLNVSYYLEGNDIVINDCEEVYIKKDQNKLIIRVYQQEVETRIKELQ